MTDISPVSQSSIDQSSGVASVGDRASPGASSVSASSRESDRVEVSAVARFLSQLREAPAVREGLVEEARSRVASGAYEASAAIEGAVDAMMDEEPGLLE